MKRPPYIIDGVEIERINPGPYSLQVLFTHGARKVIGTSHCPQTARELEQRVARNPNVIDRIELHDLTGRLETIWSRDWT